MSGIKPAVEPLPITRDEWEAALSKRENYVRGATPDLIVGEKINEIIAMVNRLAIRADYPGRLIPNDRF